MLYCHIHGFNSSPASATLRVIREFFPNTEGLSYTCADLFENNLRSLRAQILELQMAPGAGGPLVITGSSLGGFYASQLAALLSCNCVLFNPVVRPGVSLAKYLGAQTNYYTGENWEFSRQTLESYLTFADTRKSASQLKRLVVLGRNDDVLDPQEARAYWQGHAEIYETEDGHSVEALDSYVVEAIKRLAV